MQPRGQRWRRLPPARLHPDPHPPVPDALPELRRRHAAPRVAQAPNLADGSGPLARHAARSHSPGCGRTAALRHDHGPDDGDRARHGRRLRGARRDRTARDRRQVHDGLGRQRAGAAAGADASVDRRERGVAQAMGRRGRRPAARGLRSALCGLVLARVARGGRGAVGARARHRPHARLGVAGRSRGRAPALGWTVEPRVPRGDGPRKRSTVRRPLRLGQRDASRRSSPSATSR